MALNLGTLNVTFTATTRDFDRGFRKVKRSIEQLDGRAADVLDDTADKTEKVGRAAKRTSGFFDRFGKNAKALGNKLRVLAFIGGSLAGVLVSLRQEMAALVVAAGAVVSAVLLEPVRQQFKATADALSTVNDRMQTLKRIADDAGTRITAIGGGLADVVTALTATRFGMEQATDVAEGFAENMRGLGIASTDVQSKLEDVSELAKQGSVTMDSLRDAVQFTARPVRTLANALGLAESRVRELIDSGQKLPQSALVLIGQHLEDTAQQTNTLASEFNRLINTLTRMMDATGIADAVEDMMARLNEALQSPVLERGLQQFAGAIESFIRKTLPQFAQTVVQNWDTIVRTTKAAIGTLIGAALGGAPGALIGGLIGGFEKTAAVMGVVGDAVKTMATNFQSTAAVIGGLFVGRTLGSLLTRMGSVTAAVRTLVTSLGFLGGAAGGVLGLVVGGMFAYGRQMTESQRKTESLVEEVNNLTKSFEDLRLERLRNKLTEVFGQIPQAETRLANLRAESERLQKRLDEGGAFGRQQGVKQDLERTNRQLAEQKQRLDALRSARDKLLKQIEQQKTGGRAGGGGDGDAQTPFFVPERPFLQPGGPAGRTADLLDRVRRGADKPGFPSDAMKNRINSMLDAMSGAIKRAERLEQAAQNIGDAFADSFTRAVMEGEKLHNVLDSLGKDIRRIILQQTVSKPLGNLVSDFAGKMLPRMLTGGAVEAGTGNRSFAEGGVATRPSIFGEAGPEAAIPLKNGSLPVDLRGSGGGNVVINDMRGGDNPAIEQEETRTPDGRRVLELTIRDAVSDQINRGDLDRPMRNRFGVGPRTRGR